MFETGITNKTLISRIHKQFLYIKRKRQPNFFFNGQNFFQMIQMAKGHIKSYSTSSVIRVMQVKTTMRGHWAPRVGPKQNKT